MFDFRVNSHYVPTKPRGCGIEVPKPIYLFGLPPLCSRQPMGPVNKVSSSLPVIACEIGASLHEKALDRAVPGSCEIRYPASNEGYEAALRRAKLQIPTFPPTSVIPDNHPSVAKVSG